MCGVVGGIFRRPVTDRDVQAVRTAVRTLAHRGPDAEAVAVVSDANAILGFRRLAIIDLATGDQPMATGTGQHLVFNGEIYNYRELRVGLTAAGVQFRTSSDTEVLLHTLARREGGASALAQLRGMFTFGFLDVPAGVLLLARDRLGKKQLYYADCAEGFFFASEPKALLALPWITPEFAVERLPTYFTLRSVPAPGTLFRNISKLPAGCFLAYDLASGTSRVERYWSPGADGKPVVPLGEAVDRFETALLDAVRSRLVADVPLGAFLSGGLDSSLLVAAMRRLGHPVVRTFTATFPDSPDDESTLARRTSQRFETEHHEFPTRPSDFLNALPDWIELNDDPVADASSLPLLCVSRLARQAGCIVLLSGEGADELFGGYGSYHKFVLLHRLAGLVPTEAARRRLAELVGSTGAIAGQDRSRVEEYFVRRAGYLGTAALLGETALSRLFTTDARDGVALERAAGAELADLCALDLARRIPDDLLVRTDRATMGASIEARVPFLDHELVNLALRLPRAARALPGLSKVVLRRIARRWRVPWRTIVHRKIGFQLPLGTWFRGPLRGWWSLVLAERLVPGIRYEEVARLVQAHQSGQGAYEEILWRVASLEWWYRRWIGGQAAPAPLQERAVARPVVVAGGALP